MKNEMLIEMVDELAAKVEALTMEEAEVLLYEDALEFTVEYSEELGERLNTEPVATGASIALTIGGPNLYLEVHNNGGYHYESKIVGYWANAKVEKWINAPAVESLVESALYN